QFEILFFIKEGMAALETWALLLAVFSLLYIYNRWKHSFWARQGVPSAPAIPFLGHTHKLVKDKYLYNDEVYKKYGGSYLSGCYEFLSPVLVVGDPELINHILIKDFAHFQNHPKIYYKKQDPIMSNNIFVIQDDAWKKLRTIVSPSFSSGMLKATFPLLLEQADHLAQYCMKSSEEKNKELDVMEIFGAFALDSVASVFFGFEADSLENKDSAFIKAVGEIFDFTAMDQLRVTLVKSMPKSVIDFFGLYTIDSDKECFRILTKIVQDVLNTRRKGLKRGDFLDNMLEAQVKDPETVTDVCIASQSIDFLTAGIDTTQITSSFAAYYLAKHPEYQARIRKELLEKIAEHGGFNYHAVNDCKLLDACISESMRITPAITTFIDRECNKKYTIPNTSVVVPEGALVMVPVYSLHHDARYWPEPEEFRPERFMPENKDQIIPNTFFPFGGGPRICIASRFAKLQMRCALARILQNMELKLVPGKEKLRIKSTFFGLMPDDFSLLITPINEE
ncbi:unnamed protein product, partial [Meganyctiphanes norvegica]